MLPTDSDPALSPAERRQTERKKLIINVSFQSGDGTGIANTRDIGIGGLYMLTNIPLEVGTPIFMRMIVGGNELGIDGEVSFIDPGHGMGVRFQVVSEKNEEILKRELHLE
ncbi:MAG: PilZ domain-containing protein [Acidobacteriota bacterium]|nr:PilZ domain-containing protein [Acidobacteriota bacterium]